MPASAEEPKASRLPASQEAARRRINRIAYWSLPFMIIFAVLNFFPDIPTPWLITKGSLGIIFVIALGTAVIRFSLWQRDEYWRERGRDPKHPERFPGERPGKKPG